jgi:hypothetical protein
MECKKQNGKANKSVRQEMHIVSIVAMRAGDTPSLAGRSKRRPKDAAERNIRATKSAAT